MKPATLVFAALLPLGWASAALALGPGEPAPAFELTALDGGQHSLESLSGGKPLLLDFGSVFCTACREALGWLEDAQRAYAGRGLRVAAVNVDGPKAVAAVNSVCSGIGVTYPVLLDGDGSVAQAYGVEAIPYLILVGPGGRVRAVHLGRAPDPAAALGLDALLADREEQR